MLAALAFALFQATTSPAPVQLSMPQLYAEIHYKGAKEVVHRLFKDDAAWNALMHNIAGGSEDWLRFGVRLYTGADAGASESMTIAFSQSVVHNPQGFLRIPYLAFGDKLCGDLSIEPTQAEHREFVAAARQALASVSDPGLETSKTACLAQFARE